MDAIKVQGKIIDIHPEEEIKGLKKQAIIIEEDGQYPQTYYVEFLKEKTELVDFLAIGEPITVMCNLRGRKWTDPDGNARYFLSLNGWKVDKNG
jgi:hypothetical protein